MTAPRVAHSLFCDDVIQNPGNKLDFKGIYIGDMVLPSPAPFTLRRLCSVTWLICDPDDVPERVVVSLLAPGHLRPFASGTLEPRGMPLRDGAVKVVVRLVTEASAIRIGEAGDIEAWVETDNGERIRAGRMAVRFN